MKSLKNLTINNNFYIEKIPLIWKGTWIHANSWKEFRDKIKSLKIEGRYQDNCVFYNAGPYLIWLDDSCDTFQELSSLDMEDYCHLMELVISSVDESIKIGKELGKNG